MIPQNRINSSVFIIKEEETQNTSSQIPKIKKISNSYATPCTIMGGVIAGVTAIVLTGLLLGSVVAISTTFVLPLTLTVLGIGLSLFAAGVALKIAEKCCMPKNEYLSDVNKEDSYIKKDQTDSESLYPEIKTDDPRFPPKSGRYSPDTSDTSYPMPQTDQINIDDDLLPNIDYKPYEVEPNEAYGSDENIIFIEAREEIIPPSPEPSEIPSIIVHRLSTPEPSENQLIQPKNKMDLKLRTLMAKNENRKKEGPIHMAGLRGIQVHGIRVLMGEEAKILQNAILQINRYFTEFRQTILSSPSLYMRYREHLQIVLKLQLGYDDNYIRNNHRENSPLASDIQFDQFTYQNILKAYIETDCPVLIYEEHLANLRLLISAFNNQKEIKSDQTQDNETSFSYQSIPLERFTLSDIPLNRSIFMPANYALKAFGLNMTHSKQIMNKRYLELCRQYHPDKNNSPDAHQMFVRVQMVKHVLDQYFSDDSQQL